MAVLVSNWQRKIEVSDELVKLVSMVANMVLEEEKYDLDAEISIAFVDDEKMHELNNRYRGVDKPTDVLSFAMREGTPLPGEEGEQVLGDIVISLETALRQAGDYGHSAGREVAYLTVHGVLHLLGYDHEKEEDKKIMREKEEAIMNKANLSR